MAEKKSLDAAAITEKLQALTEWAEKDGKLHREYEFETFPDAFAFMTRAAFAAESMNHHPDWFNSYSKVVVDLVSHDVGGISERDFKLATAMEAIWRQVSADSR